MSKPELAVGRAARADGRGESRKKAAIIQKLKRTFPDLGRVRFVELSDSDEILCEYERRGRWYAVAPRRQTKG